MSSFKKLNQQDAFVTSYNAKKNWSLTGSDLSDFGIQVLSAQTGSTAEYYLDDTALFSGEYPHLVYRSLNQLYYSSFDKISGSINISSSFDNYVESSFTSASRFLNQEAIVFSLPRNIVGTHIEPGTLKIGSDQDYLVDQDNYIVIDYLAQSDILYDDKEGNLRKGSTSGSLVGNVIYTHGQVVITDQSIVNQYKVATSQSVAWKSNQPIYTYNYNIKVSDYEFNITQNPSAQTGSTVYNYSGSKYNRPSGILANNMTGSYFQPYITSVGLYNDANELIAVAKLAQPLPKPANTEMTIQVKLDI